MAKRRRHYVEQHFVAGTWSVKDSNGRRLALCWIRRVARLICDALNEKDERESKPCRD